MALRSAKSIEFPGIRSVILCLLISLTVSGLPSCAVTDFVSAYFNTYYNAQTLFSQAETEVMAQLDSRPGGRTWLATFSIQPGTKTKLESVIEKCSKLLQYHPDSKLVDDALLMIGKSYYYEDDNQQAMRKFNEIVSGYPNGSRAVEARLLLAYAQYRMKAREDARLTALAVVDLAKQADQPEMKARASLVLGQMAQEDKDYASAREYFDQAAESGATPEQRSAASLMSAEMYRKMDKFKEAEEAYRRAEKASNTYTGEYRGKLGAIRMIAKQGRYDEALLGMKLLRADAKNKEFFGEIELEVANTYRDMGDLPTAVDRYTLVDTTYPRSEVSARSYFALGDLYEHTLYRYDSAFVAYTKGKNEFSTAEVTPLCAHRADYLARYFQFHNQVVKYDSVVAALSAPRDTVKRDTMAARAADTSKATRFAPTVAPPPMSLDTANARLEGAVNELAGLFYASIGLPDSAEYWYLRLSLDYPSGQNAPRALYTLARIYAARDSVGSKPAVDSLYHEIIRRFPGSAFAPEARRFLGLPQEEPTVEAAEKDYDHAESLMINGDSTGAAEGFKKLARKYPGSPYASRALYAAGWIYENRVFDRDSAIAAYRALVSLYPTSMYASRISPKLTEVNQKLKQDADTSAAHRIKLAPVPAAADSLQRRNETIVPAPVPPAMDSSMVKKPTVIGPKRGPQKEGPTP